MRTKYLNKGKCFYFFALLFFAFVSCIQIQPERESAQQEIEKKTAENIEFSIDKDGYYSFVNERGITLRFKRFTIDDANLSPTTIAKVFERLNNSYGNALPSSVRFYNLIITLSEDYIIRVINSLQK